MKDYNFSDLDKTEVFVVDNKYNFIFAVPKSSEEIETIKQKFTKNLSGSTMALINNLDKEIEKLKGCYTFAEIDDSDYSKFIQDEIKRSIEGYNVELPVSEYLLSRIKDRIEEEVACKILNDKDNTIKVNYLNKKLTRLNDSNKTIGYVTEISLFFEKYGIDADIDLIMDLMVKSPKFNKLTENVYKENDVANTCELFNTILEAYCAYNKIEDQIDVDFVTGENFDYDTYNEKNMEDSVKIFLNEIHRYKVPTKEEELEYFKKIKAGDIEARKEFETRNMGLVYKVAYKYYWARHLLVLDRVNEGYMGLRRAVDKFDPEKGYKFSTYAIHWIRQAISRALADYDRAIRIPAHLSEVVLKINNFEKKYVIDYNEPPTDECIAEALDLPLTRVMYARRLKDAELVLNAELKADADEESVLQDFIKDDKVNIEDDTIRSDFQKKFDEYFENSRLDDREKEILKMRNDFYGKKYTLDECGKCFNVTRERARQIEAKALRKLRISSKVRNFVDYLDNPDRNLRLCRAYEIRNTVKLPKKGTITYPTIYSFFKDAFKEEVDMVLKLLRPQDLAIIKERFGENFDAKTPNPLNRIDCKILSGNIVPKMRKIIKKLREEQIEPVGSKYDIKIYRPEKELSPFERVAFKVKRDGLITRYAQIAKKTDEQNKKMQDNSYISNQLDESIVVNILENSDYDNFTKACILMSFVNENGNLPAESVSELLGMTVEDIELKKEEFLNRYNNVASKIKIK